MRESLQLSRGALVPLSIAVAILLAQPWFTTLAEEPQPEVAEGLFQLNVVDPDGNPVPHVEVDIRTRPVPTAEQIVTGKLSRKGKYGAFATTNEKGELAIRFDKPPASLTLMVETPGFGPYYAKWGSENQLANLPPQFTMSLDKGWTVGGIVRDEDGNPIQGVNISPSIVLKRRPGVTSEIHSGTDFKTNADGSWKYESVPDSKNELTLEFAHPDFQPMWHTVPRDGYELKPTSPLGIVTLKKGISVRGTITDDAGTPIQGALVRTKFNNNVRKATTDAQGKYVLKGCPPSMARIVVSAQGKALNKQDVRVEPDGKPVDFTMHPGGKIRVRVVDEDGKGIAKARIFFQGWDGKRIDYFEFDHVNEYADENGVWEWNEAPLEPFEADICPPKGMQLTHRTLFHRDEEFVFAPPPALVVSGSVVDAKTKKPIPKFRVIPGLRNSDPLIGMDWNKRESYDATGGQYQVHFTREYPAHLVRIEADGYQVAISRDILSDEGSVNFDFELEPAEDIAAKIVDAQGKPAVGAKIALGVAGDQISLDNGDIDDGSTYATRTDSDAEGRFRLSHQTEAYQIVITHDAGFAHFKSKDGPIPDPIQLTPWAKLEGTFRVGPDPAPNVDLSMGIETLHSYGQDVPSIFTHYDVTTGVDGKFAFDRVLPGIGAIGRRIHLLGGQGATEATSSVRIHTEFVPGETTKLDLGGSGRPVIGKLIPPPGYNQKVMWNFALISARADLQAPQRPPVPVEIQSKPQEHEAWWNGWKKTPEGQAWSAAYKAYEKERAMAPYLNASVDRDGTFRIDDVPPGSYRMRVDFEENRAGSIVNYPFTVPPVDGLRSDEAVDLGTLTLQPR